MKVSALQGNLAAQLGCAPTKNMPEEKWLVPELRKGKHKLSLEKQDVLVCHKESDLRVTEMCRKHTGARGSTRQIQDDLSQNNDSNVW